MDRADFLAEIMALPVWDTHNHLEGSKTFCASSFWDFGHYFWYARELKAAGYPDDPMELPESERAEAYAKAFHLARNTAWNRQVRATLKGLWDVEITGAKSILDADEKIAATCTRPGWAREVCERVGLQKITVGRVSDNGIREIEDLTCIMGGYRPRQVDAVRGAADQRAGAEKAAREIESDVNGFCERGVRVLRVAPPSGGEGARATDVPELEAAGNTPEEIARYLAHALFRALDARGFHLQIFVGMAPPTPGYEPRTKAHGHHALNDTRRIAELHDIFDMYSGCTFEIVNAAELSSLDIVQAARIYPNVYPGGLWWFSFRPSVYRANMQYRLEALPACRSTLIASDARCIEWCHVKITLVKRLLAEFLYDQIDRGWIDREVALYTARCWLHDTAQSVYEGKKEQ